MAKPSKVEMRVRERRDALVAEIAELDVQVDSLTTTRASLADQIAVLDGILDVPADEGDGNGDGETP